MSKKLTKKECQFRIREALLIAQKNGFIVIVASDEEGNDWSEVNPNDGIFYEDTNDAHIAIGVSRNVFEDDAFNLSE